MKNQYVGDIGDYTKLGLLRAVESSGFSVGINWYLTPDDHRPGGSMTSYLLRAEHGPDAQLFAALRELVTTGRRTVAALESAQLLSHAVYYGNELAYSSWENRKACREAWHREALRTLGGQEVIFLDPDNGLSVPSVRPYAKAGAKYVTDAEVADYYRTGASVIVYQHRDRSPEAKYIHKLTRLQRMRETESATLLCLTARAGTTRDYLILAQPRHGNKLQMVLETMLQAGWMQLCARRPL